MFNNFKYNLKAQLTLLCAQYYKGKPQIRPTLLDGIITTTVTVNQIELSKQSSKSSIYANRKAIKKAMIHITSLHEKSLSSDKDYIQKEMDSESKKELLRKVSKSNSHQDWLKKQLERKKWREERMLSKAEEANTKELLRKKSKAERKKKIELEAKLKSEMGKSKVSSNKRRYLEDKAK